MFRFKSFMRLTNSLMACGAAVGVLSSCPSSLFALTGEWITGTKETGQYSDNRFTAIGVPDENNIPRGQTYMADWVDAEGNLWIFHGATSYWNRPYGLSYDPDDKDLQDGRFEIPYRRDLWKYSPATNNWTLVKEASGPFKDSGGGIASWVGDDGNLWLYNKMQIWYFDVAASNWVMHYQMPEILNYGTKGVPAPTNSPGPRGLPVTWVDSNHDIWQFSGSYFPPIGVPGGDWENRTDLWKFDTSENMWVWVHGPDQMDRLPLYGTKGVPDPVSHPGGTGYGAARWADADGNLWLHASAGEERSGEQIWKFDVASSQWVWLTGDLEDWVAPTYGELGVAAPGNSPGTRDHAAYWTGPDGNLWLFGGQGTYGDGLNYKTFSDLWKFDTTTNLWAWMGGPQKSQILSSYVAPGVADPLNQPMGRLTAATWADASGKLGMFGGEVLGYQLNDLWTYDTATGQWTYHKGSNGRGELPVHGDEDAAAPGNDPGSRSGAAEWEDDEGNLWIYGGVGHHRAGFGENTNDQLSDLWKFETATGQWTYKGGSAETTATYGQLGVEDPSKTPGARMHASSWTDSAGYLWLFGGEIYKQDVQDYEAFSDLWRYNPNTDAWAWMGGSQTPSDPGNATSPSGRAGAAVWIDAAGDVWLFGGYSRFKTGIFPLNGQPVYHEDRYNDLWRLDSATLQWEQVLASQHANAGGNSFTYAGAAGTYGIKGQADPANRPGSRRDAVALKDAAGNFWLFGGTGYGAAIKADADGGVLNDLWKYDPIARTWTWMSGDQTIDSLATLNGMPLPQGKGGAAGWVKDGNKLIIHGGRTQGEKLNLLWAYHIVANQWSWVAPTEPSIFGTYGTRGMASEANFPGMRFHGSAFQGSDGALWLFGGEGYAQWANGYLNDLWRIDPGDIQPFPDIDLQLTSAEESPRDAVIDTPLTWSFQVVNKGTEAAADVQVAIDGDLGEKCEMYNFALPAGGSVISQTDSKVVLSIGSLQPGTLAEITATLTPKQAGKLKMKSAASVVGPALDPQIDNSVELELNVGSGEGPDLTGVWVPAEVKCKTNKKGSTRCKLKATLLLANAGNATAEKSYVRFYLSADQVVGPGDVELKGKKVGKLTAGKSKNAKVKLKLTEPATGKYLLAVVDADNAVAEGNEANNIMASEPLP